MLTRLWRAWRALLGPGWSREERLLLALACGLLGALAYSFVVVRVHRPLEPGEARGLVSTALIDRYGGALFKQPHQALQDVHVSTLICHGNSRFWALRMAADGPQHDARPSHDDGSTSGRH